MAKKILEHKNRFKTITKKDGVKEKVDIGKKIFKESKLDEFAAEYKKLDHEGPKLWH